MKELSINLKIERLAFEELCDSDRELAEEAIKMTGTSYAPYSNFHVGAAIRLASGTIVTGSNQENAAFPSGTCAERSACFYAGANYPDDPFETIAVAARESTGELTKAPISPCGGCRQALLEYEKRAGHPVRVILTASDGVAIVPSVKSLLPLAFTQF